MNKRTEQLLYEHTCYEEPNSKEYNPDDGCQRIRLEVGSIQSRWEYIACLDKRRRKTSLCLSKT